ncbi:MAG: hypothetical protein FWD93_03890 [Coriobacteriia bacterium]|nr:hypothetical protein [Coriobacteriia bacterium]
MDFKKVFKVIGPIVLLLIPVAIAVGIFLSEWQSSHPDGAYVPEGEVIYSLSQPETYGLTGDEVPGGGTP